MAAMGQIPRSTERISSLLITVSDYQVTELSRVQLSTVNVVADIQVNNDESLNHQNSKLRTRGVTGAKY